MKLFYLEKVLLVVLEKVHKSFNSKADVTLKGLPKVFCYLHVIQLCPYSSLKLHVR